MDQVWACILADLEAGWVVGSPGKHNRTCYALSYLLYAGAAFMVSLMLVGLPILDILVVELFQLVHVSFFALLTLGNCSNATASPCIGHADCSLSSASTKSTASPSKSNSSSSSASPLTPRRLTARAALLLRKKAAVNNASSAPTSCSQNSECHVVAAIPALCSIC